MPEDLNARLLPHQKEGLRYVLDKRGRALIADEPGLGKTLVAVAAASIYASTGDWPCLVICPSSLREMWRRELVKWVPHLREEIENGALHAGAGSGGSNLLSLGMRRLDAKSQSKSKSKSESESKSQS